MTEIMVASWDRNLYMWDYDYPFSPGGLPPWPQFHHDARRTGLATNLPFVAVPEPAAPAAALAFAGPGPNPARAGARVWYTVPAGLAGSALELAIYDLAGRRVRVLARGPARAGPHSVAWDLRDAGGARAGAGVYFLQLTAGRERRSHKLVVLR
jgi:hypothetical protein